MADYRIAFWNLENLFDVEDSPRRSDKLQRVLAGDLSGWTRDVLDRKIRQLASVITRMNGGQGPDLLGVCEIENAFVLGLLRDALTPLGRDYRIAHADTQDHRGIDVAFLYDGALFGAEEQFSHFIVKRNATRDLFQVNFRTDAGRLLVIVGNHWPSRRGGELQSEPYRCMAGETLAYFHERIRAIHGENVAVLAMGDFNDEPFKRALVDYALSERSATKVVNAQNPKFLNLMWSALGAGIGTHYFNNQPNVLDQFLVSKGLVTGDSGIRAIPESLKVVRFPEMVDTGDYPKPIPYGRKNAINPDGFSDHFPISVTLSES